MIPWYYCTWLTGISVFCHAVTNGAKVEPVVRPHWTQTSIIDRTIGNLHFDSMFRPFDDLLEPCGQVCLQLKQETSPWYGFFISLAVACVVCWTVTLESWKLWWRNWQTPQIWLRDLPWSKYSGGLEPLLGKCNFWLWEYLMMDSAC